MGIDEDFVVGMRYRYPEGTRVELEYMEDDYSDLERGERGTVISVDDLGTIHVRWDSGSGLGLIHGRDQWKVI